MRSTLVLLACLWGCPKPGSPENGVDLQVTSEESSDNADMSKSAKGKVDDAARLLARGTLEDARKAEKLLEAAIAAEPELASAYLNLGIAMQIQGDTVAAQQQYQEALKLNPKLALAWLYLGNSYLDTGDFSRGIETLQAGLVELPESTPLRAGLIHALRRNGQFDLAIEEAQQALKVNTKALELYDALGQAYIAKGDLPLARFVFQKASKAVPGAEEDPSIRTQIGWIDLQRGERQQATAYFQAALQKDPEHVPALMYLSGIYLDDRNYADALSLLETAKKYESRNAGFWLNIGIAYRGLGKYAEAQAAYETASRIDPTNSDPWLNLGILYGDYLKLNDTTLGSYDKAIDAFQEVVKLGGPNTTLAKGYIADLEKEKKKAEKRKAKGEK